ncbi:MAG: hypothetical protein E6K94_08785 [Thaumarchaeota archaeon]|nr:MAG: hypothetical protein E6K94_08785 [Nitrososphaerota archaeon]
MLLQKMARQIVTMTPEFRRTSSRGGALLKDDSQITTNDENSPMSPKCPDKGPIPPNWTIDPFLK